MSASLKLIAPQGYLKGTAVLTTAQIAGIPIQQENIAWKQIQNPDFLNKNPQGTVPVLQISENQYISETSSILRYLARVAEAKGLYGENVFENAQVDSILDLVNLEIQPFAFALTSPVLGWLSFNQGRYELAKADLQKHFQILNEQLQMKTYLVGTKLTIADISLFATLYPLFRFILTEEVRKQYNNITRWFLNIAQQPIFVRNFGKAYLAKTEWTEEGQVQVTQVQQVEQKQQTSAAAPQKKEKAGKQQQQKQAKKAEPKQKAEKPAEEPVKKTKNPLEELPESKFDLFDYKTQITNSKDRKASVQYLFDNFDAQGFSMYLVEYEKYEGEGVVLYQTSNLKDSFLQRLDHFRKYSYGVHGVYGEEKNYDIFGVWIWRGVGIPQEIKDLPNYEYHKWTKLDLAKDEDRKLVLNVWTEMEADKSIVRGKVARDVTCYK